MSMRHNGPMLEEEEPSRCFKFWYYTWKVCTCIISHVTLISMVVSYCILGSFTFERLEKDNEIRVKSEIPYIRSNLTDKLWQYTQNTPVLEQVAWTDEVKAQLKLFETDLLTAMKKDGWDGNENITDGLQWTKTGSLFYSIIVITTIGYGHIAPKTHWGKVVTIFYAILGIPLMLLCLSNIGDIMAHSFRFIYWKVCCYVCTRRPKKHHRRGRSVRGGTIRQGNRGSGKSRSASFRRSARTSQRSADSALGLSDSLMTRSSYSDTECRYYDDAGVEVVLTSPGGPPAPAQGLQRLRGPSQHSRLSDTTLQAPPHAGPTNQGMQVTPVQAPTPSPGTSSADDSMAGQNNSWRKGQRGQQQDIEMENLPSGRGDSVKSTYSLPAQNLNRYSRQGSSRLGRLREDEMDEFEMRYMYDPEPEFDETVNKPVPIWLCVFLVLSYIIGGAFLFLTWEGWSFLDSAYFCFITLTTIGFGDFVPAQNTKDNSQFNAEWSIAMCSLYLLFGIALLAMSFNLVQEEVINSVKSVARRLGIIKDEDEDED